MKLLYFYVPETHLEQVKTALFSIGLGKFNNYDCCAFQYKGQGQFRPLDGSKPFIGDVGGIEEVIEYKVEMICEDALVDKARDKLKEAHPYEEVAYGFLELLF